MQINTQKFKQQARIALADASLQQALGNLKSGFPNKRAAAIAKLPEFNAMREQAANIKDHVLANLDVYLETFENNVQQQGGHVHWATDDKDACHTILEICQSINARTVTKGKSMVTEEIGLNDFLQQNNIQPIETDLGEYILQLRDEHPSHIIAPAIHLNLGQVSDTFTEQHKTPRTEDPKVLMQEARDVLRDHFVAADVGITGANFFIAETGSTMIVTNEGNGDLTQTLPKVHIVVTSIEKCLPTLEDLSLFIRLLSRSSTGQETTVYSTLSSGPKRAEDQDGPEQFHVVLVDNGRSKMLGQPLQPMLRCIRCSACMNHCPVYDQIGGHAYGWVYPGPMGSVLTPQIVGIHASGDLPNASTFCGKCEEVCPVKIPLPSLLRTWREVQFNQGNNARTARIGIKLWAWLAKHPKLYQIATRLAVQGMLWFGGKQRRITHLPLASGWTLWRDMPAPDTATGFPAKGNTFQQQWQQHSQTQQAATHE